MLPAQTGALSFAATGAVPEELPADASVVDILE